MTLWKIIPTLIASGFLVTACGPHTHQPRGKVLVAENAADVSATIVTAQLSDKAFNLRAEGVSLKPHVLSSKASLPRAWAFIMNRPMLWILT